VKVSIRESCAIRNWALLAINVRSNHVHTVVSARQKSETVLNAFKANATRRLRESGLWSSSGSPWADKGSRRRLWNEQSVANAVAYVLYGQGEDLPEF
jgi:REP element-mobilizing transposase RayT